MNKRRFSHLLLEICRDLFESQVGDKSVFSKIIVQYPREELGHYATSAAMVIGSHLRTPPLEIAELIKEKLEMRGFFSRVDVAKPGFINVFLTENTFKEGIRIFSENLEKSRPSNGKRVLLEYVSANPTGPLHIGHGRWAVVGSSLSNVLKYLGYDVFQEFYVNDYGNQIKLLRESAEAVRKGEDVPEDGYRGAYMEAFKTNFDDPVEYFKSEQKRLLEKLRVNFDNFFSEKSLYDKGLVQEAIEEARNKGVIYSEGGAVWFRTTDYGDDKDRVVIKQDGDMTYYASDIAYHRDKVLRADMIIDILGADHHGYVKRLEAIVKVFGNEKTEFRVLVGQLVSLFREGVPVRMSKRTGEMVTLEEVVDEIGVDATRYFLLMLSLDTALDFDLGAASAENSNNPVYYAQYAYARISSTLKKAEEFSISPCSKEEFDLKKINDAYRDSVIMMMMKFDDVLDEIESSLQPYHLCQYLYDLSSIFHRYYIDVKFIDFTDSEKTRHYLYFITIIQKTLKKGLDLIGVEALKRM